MSKFLKTLLLAALILPLFVTSIAAKGSPEPATDAKLKYGDDYYGASAVETDTDGVDVVLVPYSQKDLFTQTGKFVGTYDIYNEFVKSAGDLDQAKKYAAEAFEIDESKIKVLSLMDIDVYEADGAYSPKDYYSAYTVKITCKGVTEDNFLCMLHYSDGSWAKDRFYDAVVAENGCVELENYGFSSPFCIIIKNTSIPNTAVRSSLQCR